jgi:hypothetical protein
MMPGEYIKYMPEGEPAKAFAPDVLVWSEMGVRVAIHRALTATAQRKNKDLRAENESLRAELALWRKDPGAAQRMEMEKKRALVSTAIPECLKERKGEDREHTIP